MEVEAKALISNDCVAVVSTVGSVAVVAKASIFTVSAVSIIGLL